MKGESFDKRSGLAFVIFFGVVSLFADAAYEGMRGISGPFLAMLGASGMAVGIVAGLGELAGYMLRLVAGRAADRTRLYWPITLAGYAVQMLAVPAMALAGNWWIAALLIVAERAGKAIRNPPRDMMLSRAGEHIGQGWAFGLHEALDQTGALLGPLMAAAVMALHHDYRAAFAWLAVPAFLTILLVFAARLRFPSAGLLSHEETETSSSGTLPREFWFYAVAAALAAFGFADYTLIAYHFEKANTVSPAVIPVLYALAMGAAGAGSLFFGRWYDRRGLAVLLPATAIAIVIAPLAFLGNFAAAAAGTILWGVSLGVHEAVMSAAVASMVPVAHRARAYGLFTAIFGIAWFLGSVAMGALYDFSLGALVILSVTVEIVALIPLLMLLRPR